MFTNLKNILFNKKIKKIETKKNKFLKNIAIDEIKDIILLFDCTEEQYKEFENIYTIYKNKGKNIKAIVFFDSKILPHYCIHSTNIEYLTRENINWIGIPNTNTLSIFLQNRYDLAIDFSHGENKSLKWIFALTTAKCKISTSKYADNDIADISIVLDEKPKLSFAMEQIEIYLNMLKNQKQ